jgi:ATP-dependent DNA ligase
MLHGQRGIGIAYAIFDILEWDGLATLNWTYGQRRELLEDLNLRGSHWDTAAAFESGARARRSSSARGAQATSWVTVASTSNSCEYE